MTPLEVVLATLAALAIGVLAFALAQARRQLDTAQRPVGPDPVVELLQRQIEAVRAESRAGQDGLRQEVGELGGRLRDDVGALRLAVAGELRA